LDKITKLPEEYYDHEMVVIDETIHHTKRYDPVYVGFNIMSDSPKLEIHVKEER
jgi:hypothetical protein